MKIVVLINGYGGSGKDAFIEQFNEQVPWKVENLSTITPVNSALKQLGWDGITKDWKYRRFASEVKRLWKEYNDGPVQYIQNRVAQMDASTNTIIFVHTREVAEIRQFQRYFSQCTNLLIKRPGVKITSNASDAQVNDMEYDYVVNNDDDLIALRKKALRFWASLNSHFSKNSSLVK